MTSSNGIGSGRTYERLAGSGVDASNFDQNAASSQRQWNPVHSDWMRVDESGKVSTVAADKQRIVREFGVPLRDLRVLDPSLPLPYPTSLFCRSKAVLINIEAIRMIICKDQAYVLSVPVPGQSLLQTCAPQLHAPFVKTLLHYVQMRGSHPSGGACHEDPMLPFELRCVEAALDAAISVLAFEAENLERGATPMLQRVAQKVTYAELEGLRDLRASLSKLLNRVSKLKQELEIVLGSEAEMKQMYLSRRHAQTNDPILPAAAAASNRQSDDALDDALEDKTEQGPTAREAWKHSIKSVNTMLHTLKSMHEAVEDNSTWGCANLLDSSLMQVDCVVQKLRQLQDRITATEGFIDNTLDHRRNQLVSLDIVVTAVMTAFAFVSMIGSIFGMNLSNGFETSHGMFLSATFGSCAAAIVLFLAIMGFAWTRRLLLIPESKQPQSPDSTL